MKKRTLANELMRYLLGCSFLLIFPAAICIGVVIGQERGVFMGILLGYILMAVLIAIWVAVGISAIFIADQIYGAGGLCQWMRKRWSDNYDSDGDATTIESWFMNVIGYLVMLFVHARENGELAIGLFFLCLSLITSVMLRHYGGEDNNPALFFAAYAVLIASLAFLLSKCTKRS